MPILKHSACDSFKIPGTSGSKHSSLFHSVTAGVKTETKEQKNKNINLFMLT